MPDMQPTSFEDEARKQLLGATLIDLQLLPGDVLDLMLTFENKDEARATLIIHPILGIQIQGARVATSAGATYNVSKFKK